MKPSTVGDRIGSYIFGALVGHPFMSTGQVVLYHLLWPVRRGIERLTGAPLSGGQSISPDE